MTDLRQRTAPALAAPLPPRKRPRGDGRVALFFIAPVLIGFAIGTFGGAILWLASRRFLNPT